MERAEFEAAIKQYYPFLLEARKRLIGTLIVFGVATVAGFVFYEQIIKVLVGVLALRGVNIVFTSPFQFINLAVSCGLAVGVIAALPVLVMQVVSFLLPALKKTESRLLTSLLPVSVVLFMLGFGFGVMIMRWQIELFLSKSLALGIGNILDISSLLSTVLITAVITGVAFQFPLLLLGLMRLNLVSREQVASKRTWVYAGFLVFSMLLPSDSIITDLLIAAPLVGLFELTLVVGRVPKKGSPLRVKAG